MKPSLLLILASLLVFRPVAFGGGFQGTLNLESAEVKQVLPLYKDISGLELIMDSRVKEVRWPVTLQSSKALDQNEALKLIEKALLEQAGVVITRLGDKRASVTYNDALPITPPKK